MRGWRYDSDNRVEWATSITWRRTGAGSPTGPVDFPAVAAVSGGSSEWRSGGV